MTTRPQHILVMAKAPVAGRVKTRLCPPYSHRAAAAVAEAALADTLEAVAACQAEVKLVALDGAPGPWLPPGLRVIPQGVGNFNRRLVNAWAATRADTGGWGLQIGMDTPQVTAGELDGLLARLASSGPGDHGAPAAVLGHARDGGWWVIGLPGTDPDLVFTGIAMSTPTTGRQQERRLRDLGLAILAAPVRRDIDDADDLWAVAGDIPASRTAVAAAAGCGAARPARC